MRAHLPQVWRVAHRILRHREDTEDVVQEVFLVAHRSLAGFRGESRFSTWLCRIAVTRALNHLERAEEKVRRSSLSIDATAADGAPDPNPGAMRGELVDRSPSPLRTLESRELMRRLRDCFEKLPSTWRAVVALRDGEDRSYEEIAAVLGLALGTVRSRLARARLSLRECVGGESS